MVATVPSSRRSSGRIRSVGSASDQLRGKRLSRAGRINLFRDPRWHDRRRHQQKIPGLAVHVTSVMPLVWLWPQISAWPAGGDIAPVTDFRVPSAITIFPGRRVRHEPRRDYAVASYSSTIRGRLRPRLGRRGLARLFPPAITRRRTRPARAWGRAARPARGRSAARRCLAQTRTHERIATVRRSSVGTMGVAVRASRTLPRVVPCGRRSGHRALYGEFVAFSLVVQARRALHPRRAPLKPSGQAGARLPGERFPRPVLSPRSPGSMRGKVGLVIPTSAQRTKGERGRPTAVRRRRDAPGRRQPAATADRCRQRKQRELARVPPRSFYTP